MEICNQRGRLCADQLHTKCCNDKLYWTCHFEPNLLHTRVFYEAIILKTTIKCSALIYSCGFWFQFHLKIPKILINHYVVLHG